MSKQDDYCLNAIDSLGRLPLSEQVYITLKQAILNGSLKPNVKLNEVKIAEQLSVSATPVREAFRKLAKDKLVVIRPWKGVTVKECSPQEIISRYQCREVMEGLGARLCAANATEEQKQELREIAEAQRIAKTQEEYIDLNTHFHHLIAQTSGNEYVIDYLADFKEMVNRDMYVSTQDPDRVYAYGEEHSLIIEAILAGDADGAEEAMRNHIQNAFIYKKAHADLSANPCLSSDKSE